MALAHISGTIQERYNYEPYGTITIADANGTPRSATLYDNTLTFQGRRYDAETGLYYFRNRYQSPVLGRFAQRDQFGYVDGMNLYGFCSSNPASQSDPSGISTVSERLLPWAIKEAYEDLLFQMYSETGLRRVQWECAPGGGSKKASETFDEKTCQFRCVKDAVRALGTFGNKSLLSIAARDTLKTAAKVSKAIIEQTPYGKFLTATELLVGLMQGEFRVKDTGKFVADLAVEYLVNKEIIKNTYALAGKAKAMHDRLAKDVSLDIQVYWFSVNWTIATRT